MTTNTNVPSLKNPAGPSDIATQWTEARLAYPLYAALSVQFNLAPLPHPAGELPPQRPTRDVFDADLKWFDTIDEDLRAFQIRQLPPEILNASEEGLRAFLQRQLKKQEKTPADRDKIDLLLVQYFALCAPEDLYRKDIGLEDVARVLQPALGDADVAILEWCAPLDEILEKIAQCHSLRDMMEHGLLEQGRLVKESAGPLFYDPAALVAFCRFNFLLRRAFIRLLHADLSAVQQAVEALDSRGVKTVDCRRAGFSAAETTIQLRYYCENWRQPFHKDYTASSVRRAFEQLLAVRADLEEALGTPQIGKSLTKISSEAIQTVVPDANGEEEKTAISTSPAPAAVQVSRANAPAPKNANAGKDANLPAPRPPSIPPAVSQPANSANDGPVPATSTAEMEKCLEGIWEQLIAAPPSRGRSMSTVVLQDTKVLLSSWEVGAFVADGGQEAEDLRRAVVARALLGLAMDQRKRSGDLTQLASALVLARTEVSYFQGRVEQAKRAKNTEAAVNLGISTKRLLSTIEEAEKLQP
ncbi:MAG TPA: hypothetical protein VN881_14685 [Candidatus Acidoferrales bacterium]|nr:hypothetical protein [Candidatus Acidoferrales bacterium]